MHALVNLKKAKRAVTVHTRTGCRSHRFDLDRDLDLQWRGGAAVRWCGVAASSFALSPFALRWGTCAAKRRTRFGSGDCYYSRHRAPGDMRVLGDRGEGRDSVAPRLEPGLFFHLRWDWAIRLRRGLVDRSAAGRRTTGLGLGCSCTVRTRTRARVLCSCD